jgi:hypothetical protein
VNEFSNLLGGAQLLLPVKATGTITLCISSRLHFGGLDRLVVAPNAVPPTLLLARLIAIAQPHSARRVRVSCCNCGTSILVL